MKWSMTWFATFSLTIAWNFYVLILWFLALIVLERTIEYGIHRYRKWRKGNG